MNIKTRKAQIVSEVDECIAELSPEEVIQAIKEYVESKGPNAISITLKTDIESSCDEWGMNWSRYSVFKGATVVVKPSVHKG